MRRNSLAISMATLAVENMEEPEYISFVKEQIENLHEYDLETLQAQIAGLSNEDKTELLYYFLSSDLAYAMANTAVEKMDKSDYTKFVAEQVENVLSDQYVDRKLDMLEYFFPEDSTTIAGVIGAVYEYMNNTSKENKFALAKKVLSLETY